MNTFLLLVMIFSIYHCADKIVSSSRYFLELQNEDIALYQDNEKKIDEYLKQTNRFFQLSSIEYEKKKGGKF